jgi:hypothetical protein
MVEDNGVGMWSKLSFLPVLPVAGRPREMIGLTFPHKYLGDG